MRLVLVGIIFAALESVGAQAAPIARTAIQFAVSETRVGQRAAYPLSVSVDPSLSLVRREMHITTDTTALGLDVPYSNSHKPLAGIHIVISGAKRISDQLCEITVTALIRDPAVFDSTTFQGWSWKLLLENGSGGWHVTKVLLRATG